LEEERGDDKEKGTKTEIGVKGGTLNLGKRSGLEVPFWMISSGTAGRGENGGGE